MKRTKSMVYKETIESREIFLCLTNDGDFYRKRIISVINALREKAKKGEYITEKAIDAYYPLVKEYITKHYNRWYGSPDFMLSVQDRFTVAVDLEERYKEDQVFYGLKEN